MTILIFTLAFANLVSRLHTANLKNTALASDSIWRAVPNFAQVAKVPAASVFWRPRSRIGTAAKLKTHAIATSPSPWIEAGEWDETALIERALPLFPFLERNGGAASVRPGINGNGVRGLVADHDIKDGDVILEIPLSLAIWTGGEDSESLERVAPEWTWNMHWSVQLAIVVLEQRAKEQRNGMDIDPFLASWPEPPPVPKIGDVEEFVQGSDPDLVTKANAADAWLEELYWKARKGAAAEKRIAVYEDTSFPSLSAFRSVMQLVWSRGVTLTAGKYGQRHCLVPVLDLANHDSISINAQWAFANSSVMGPSIRLYALQDLRRGDDVTVTYGKHTSSHFALVYGFVPWVNPHDFLRTSLLDILSATPAYLGGSEPPQGWAAEIERIVPDGTRGKDHPANGAMRLRLEAPSGLLLRALAELLPGGIPAAVEALAFTAAQMEISMFNLSASNLAKLEDEAWAVFLEDRTLLQAAIAGNVSLADHAKVILKLRLQKRWLLISLRRRMIKTAKAWSENPEQTKRELEMYVRAVDEFTRSALYSDFRNWAERGWDWQTHTWLPRQTTNSNSDSGTNLKELPTFRTDLIDIHISAIVMCFFMGTAIVVLWLRANLRKHCASEDIGSLLCFN